MAYLFICLTSFLVSILTLFSGFGLGTVLMPVFAIFFSVPISISATAVVHLANNFFKLAIVGPYADKQTVFKFGIPAAIAAALGAYFLGFFSILSPLFSYQISSYQFDLTLVGVIIGLIVIFSAFFELIPNLSQLSFNQKYLIPGGILSGFFGGLSGHQGILRSAFLIKAGLNKEQFIGTSVLCSAIVDAVRILVYGWSFYSKKFVHLSLDLLVIITLASLSAFLGAYIGSRLIEKVTFKALQVFVSVILILFGLAMIFGLIKST